MIAKFIRTANILAGVDIDATFVAAVQPLLTAARKMYGEELFKLVPKV